ncbi:hypothetical protein [Dyella sedimenti]|uniref:hypothetical protein n=1 Tax=Dyella sedimenti TaxID=2919947 RepID=UPI001FA98C58|nr:hypothetical protein [Dyella sedimenti]
MAYFKLSAPTRLYEYPFDYHSHLGGILPVRGKTGLSLAGWLAGADQDKGEQLLFDQALRLMLESNPFDLLARRADKTSYERGECAAENIYIACVLIAQRMRPQEGIDGLPVTDPGLYRAAQQSMQAALASSGEDRRWMLALMRYFNGKIYSSNKFTPFDDAYKTRSSMVDRVRADPKQGQAQYQKWITVTLGYLLGQGIRHIQIPASASDIPTLDEKIQAFNAANGTQYRALVHTPAAYLGGRRLAEELDKLLPQLTDPHLASTIGLDVLGVENRVADYAALFAFLRKNQDALANALNTKHSKSMVVHIHNGEGASTAADHRSLIGYYLAYGDPAPDAEFYRAMARYIARCAQTAKERQATEGAGSQGAPGFGAGLFSRLFDELFLSGSLTHRGCRLRRFGINGERSRELVAYNGKRSVMALSETFDTPADPGQSTSWYELLTAARSPYTFRLGHDYYYRHYMAAKYPVLAFDTNLGSNAITGAAGLFASGESYRINRGFRHLDGYIDTGVLAAASTAVAYMSSDTLTEQQIAFYLATSQRAGTMESVLAADDVKPTLRGYLAAALGPACCEDARLDLYYTFYAQLVTGIVGQSAQSGVRYQALTRVYTVFRNWRSYLLGADGQGVEHSDIQDEFLRMLLLLAYNLLPIGQERLLEDTLDQLQKLLLLIASAYWDATVGGVKDAVPLARRTIERLEGYKSPASVIGLQRADVPGA